MKRKRLKFPNSLKLECVSKKKNKLGFILFLNIMLCFALLLIRNLDFLV